MKPTKFKAWHKNRKEWVSFTDNGYFFNPWNGQIYHGSLNVTSRIELVQFTGLYDMNGKGIFIGDVLSYNSFADEYYEVIINEFSQIPVIDNDGGQEALYKCNKKCMVVGNTFENPELMEVGAI